MYGRTCPIFKELLIIHILTFLDISPEPHRRLLGIPSKRSGSAGYTLCPQDVLLARACTVGQDTASRPCPSVQAPGTDEENLRSFAQYSTNSIATTIAATPMTANMSGMLPPTIASRGTLISDMANCPKFKNVE